MTVIDVSNNIHSYAFVAKNWNNPEWFEDVKVGRWKPSPYEDYWFVNDAGKVLSTTWVDHSMDNWRYSQRQLLPYKRRSNQLQKVFRNKSRILRYGRGTQYRLGGGLETRWPKVLLLLLLSGK